MSEYTALLHDADQLRAALESERKLSAALAEALRGSHGTIAALWLYAKGSEKGEWSFEELAVMSENALNTNRDALAEYDRQRAER